MILLSRLRSFVTKLENTPLVATNEEIKQQAEVLRTEADRMVDVIDQASGIWHQDMIMRRYRPRPTVRPRRVR